MLGFGWTWSFLKSRGIPLDCFQKRPCSCTRDFPKPILDPDFKLPTYVTQLVFWCQELVGEVTRALDYNFTGCCPFIFVHPWLCKTPTSKQTTNYGWCDHFDPDRESNMMAQSPFFSQHNYTYMDRDIILDQMINIQYGHILHSSITSRSSVVATPMQRWSSPQHVASSLRPHTHTHTSIVHGNLKRSW